MQLPIYLDNHATTPCDPRVVEAMLPYFTDHFGNAASTGHPYGWKAKEAVELGRSQLAHLISCEPAEIIFTSGATEAINMVLKGIARTRSYENLHIITSSIEHSAVLDTCDFLQKHGATITRLNVNNDGLIDLNALEQALNSSPADLVSLMHANNEIGIINPLAQIAEICTRHNVPLHIDAAQSVGKIPVHFKEWNISFLSLSGHKLYAPKGVGALVVRRQIPPLRLMPLVHGGGHERGFRSGTLNVPGIVGLGKAAEICSREMTTEADRASGLRDQLLAHLKAAVPGLLVNGSLHHRLPGNLNISIPGIESQHLLPAIRDSVSLSSGSACTSSRPTPSHVLTAIGRNADLATASLRFGIGRFNTSEHIHIAAEAVAAAVKSLRTPQ